MNWRNPDFLGLGYVGGIIDRSILGINLKDWTTKKTERMSYLMVGSTLVKVLIEATMNEGFGKAGMTCKVLEIDGEIIPLDEQDKKIAVIRLINNDVPTPQEQINLLLEALGNFDIKGRPAKVSDDYARGHIRMLGMKTRLAMKGKEAAECS